MIYGEFVPNQSSNADYRKSHPLLLQTTGCGCCSREEVPDKENLQTVIHQCEEMKEQAEEMLSKL